MKTRLTSYWKHNKFSRARSLESCIEVFLFGITVFEIDVRPSYQVLEGANCHVTLDITLVVLNFSIALLDIGKKLKIRVQRKWWLG